MFKENKDGQTYYCQECELNAKGTTGNVLHTCGRTHPEVKHCYDCKQLTCPKCTGCHNEKCVDEVAKTSCGLLSKVNKLHEAAPENMGEEKCCKKCYHINTAHETSLNYCSDRDCSCHVAPPTTQSWSERIEKELFLPMRCKYSSDIKDHHADVDWSFIERDVLHYFSQTLQEAVEQERKRITEGMEKMNEKYGNFSSDAKEMCEKFITLINQTK